MKSARHGKPMPEFLCIRSERERTNHPAEGSLEPVASGDVTRLNRKHAKMASRCQTHSRGWAV